MQEPLRIQPQHSPFSIILTQSEQEKTRIQYCAHLNDSSHTINGANITFYTRGKKKHKTKQNKQQKQRKRFQSASLYYY